MVRDGHAWVAQPAESAALESLSEAPPTSRISHNRSHRLLTTQVLALGISNVLADALSMVMSE